MASMPCLRLDKDWLEHAYMRAVLRGILEACRERPWETSLADVERAVEAVLLFVDNEADADEP